MQKVNVFKKIYKPAGKAIFDFNMIENNDVIMVGLSGGKDSWVLFDTLYYLMQKAPVNFKLIATKLNYNSNQNNKPIEEFFYKNYPEAEFKTIETNIDEIINNAKVKGDGKCSICSRLRRGFLYTYASKIKATKIALGHHREDFNETLLMSMFFNGKLKSMAAKLLTDDKQHVLIRPLVYVNEDDIAAYAKQKKFVILDCPCSTKSNTRRDFIKNMLNNLQKSIPEVKNSLLASQKHIVFSHLLNNKK